MLTTMAADVDADHTNGRRDSQGDTTFDGWSTSGTSSRPSGAASGNLTGGSSYATRPQHPRRPCPPRWLTVSDQ